MELIRRNYEKVFREHFYSFRVNTYNYRLKGKSLDTKLESSIVNAIEVVCNPY